MVLVPPSPPLDLDWRAPELRELQHPGRFRRVDWEEPCVRAASWFRHGGRCADLVRHLRATLGRGPLPQTWRELAAHREVWAELARRWGPEALKVARR